MRQFHSDYSDLASSFSAKHGRTQVNNLRWLSPSQESLGYDPFTVNMEDGLDPRHSSGVFADAENGQATINYNGNCYHVLLVPSNIPGGIQTISGVRLGLLRTWLHSPKRDKSRPNSGEPTNLDDIKMEENTLTNLSDKNADRENVYDGDSVNNDRSGSLTALQHLMTLETQLAHMM